MSKTLISWTDETLNPLVGCSKTIAKGAKESGCKNCYAETAAATPRLQQFPQYQGVIDQHGHWNGHIEFVPKQLEKLFHMKEPRRIFMPSMSDPFHENVKDEWLDQIMAAIALTPHLTVQMLTKRPRRMQEYFDWCERRHNDLGKPISFCRVDAVENVCINSAIDGIPRPSFEIRQWPLPNLWLGVTVENQAAADERIWQLIETPASVRFLSIEPMLEEIDLSEWLHLLACPQHPNERAAGWGHPECDCQEWFLKHIDSGKINFPRWLIIGGESGSNARPFHLEWAESIIDQCNGLPFLIFFKQLGSNAFYQGKPFKTKSRAGTDPSEWPEHLRIQKFPGEKQ